MRAVVLFQAIGHVATGGLFAFSLSKDVAEGQDVSTLTFFAAVAFALVVVSTYTSAFWRIRTLTVGSPRIVVDSRAVTRSAPMHRRIEVFADPEQQSTAVIRSKYRYDVTDVAFFNRPREHNDQSQAKRITVRVGWNGKSFTARWIDEELAKPDDVGPIQNLQQRITLDASHIPARLPLVAKADKDEDAYLCHPGFDQAVWRDSAWKLGKGWHDLTVWIVGNNVKETAILYRMCNPGKGKGVVVHHSPVRSRVRKLIDYILRG